MLPITPTAEVWSSMSASARDAFLVQVLDVLNDPNSVMGEGRPHLAVVGGKLQLFHGMAELFGTGQLLGRLRGMMSDLEVKASEADGRALQADGRASQAEDALREAILALLEARGIDMPESARDTLQSCADPATLRRWLLQGVTATSHEELFR
ncbi:MAG: hypothetical protein WCI05_14800 [Myxococcales bacterium]